MTSRKWEVLKREIIHIDGNVHLKRYKLIKTPIGGIYLHRFKRPDADRHMHDHPWNFMTFVLWGSYDEKFTDPTMARNMDDSEHRHWRWLSVHKMNSSHAHMVTRISKNLTTLMFVGKKNPYDWGFYTDAGWVHWQVYDRIREQENL